MWLLVLNGMIYLAYGIVSGHLSRRMLPLSPRAMLHDVLDALRGRLAHDDLSVYNAAQNAAYLGAILLAIGLILSGLVIWKPVQFYALGSLIGDYEGARLLHFFCMAGSCCSCWCTCDGDAGAADLPDHDHRATEKWIASARTTRAPCLRASSGGCS